MKKILCIILSLIIACSMVACGNETEPEKPSKQPEVTQPTETIEQEEITEPEEPEVSSIRENGKMPSEKSEWTQEEKDYYYKEVYDKVVQAVIDLDFETLEEYVEESDLYELKAIENNPQFKEMYRNTYGKMIYLPETEYMVYKSTRYTYSTWYTSFYLTNNVMPANTNELTKEDVDEIYNNIYEKAPYEATEFERSSSHVEVIDGYVKYDIQAIFYDIDAFDFYTLTPNAYENPYAKFIFGDEFEIEPKLKVIGNHREIAEAIYNYDVDKILAYLEEHCSSNSTSTGKYVMDAYRNKENHEKMTEWFKENCRVSVSNGGMHIYYITDSFDIAKNHFPFSVIQESEYEKVNNLDSTYGVWGLLSTEDQHIYTQRDLLDLMEEDGIIER